MIRLGRRSRQRPGSRLKVRLALQISYGVPKFHYQDLEQYHLGNPALSESEKEGVEISIKYSGYIARQAKQIEHAARQEQRRIPDQLDYTAIQTLSMEAREKLSKVQPLTIGQASRIGGVNPADINALLFHLEVMHRKATAPVP